MTDVWVVMLDGPTAADVEHLARRVLDADERAGVATKRDPTDRRRALASHLALRLVLGPGLGVHPADVRFARAACPLCGAPHGRPVLADRARRAERSFSLSRAGGLAAIAVSAGPLAVGIDVESLPPRVGADDLLAGRHPDEAQALDALPRAERDLAALRCWTRTEAVLKGWGTGLGIDPSSVAVGLGSAPAIGQVLPGAVAPVALPEHDLRRTGWTVADVGVAAPAVVAVAVGSNAAPGPRGTSASPPALRDVAVHEVDLAALIDRAGLTSLTPRPRR